MEAVIGEQFVESYGCDLLEYLFRLMAKDCGINIGDSELLEENGHAHFIIPGFDRNQNTKHYIQALRPVRIPETKKAHLNYFMPLFESVGMNIQTVFWLINLARQLRFTGVRIQFFQKAKSPFDD